MTKEIAICAEGLSKRYRLGSAGTAHDSLRDLLASGARALMGRGRTPRGNSQRQAFFALRDASFEILRGENVGIIGANGAGKSTLLKILSRIVEPTSGRALVAGRVGALLEVGTGFHGELTGRENIYLYGAILGMTQREIAAKFDAIVDFAEIEQFIDTPVKRYSSGMYVRLAFSVAAHLRPDILLLDEVLAVGDAAFQRKCMNFARELQRQEATILFVSHNMFSIKAMCTRVIYLQSGRIEYDGPTDPGIEIYERGAHLSVVPWSKDNPDDWAVELTDIELSDQAGKPKSVFDFGERMKIRLRFNARERLEAPNVMVAFVRSDGVASNVYATDTDKFVMGAVDGEGTLELTTSPLKLVAERYVIHVLFRMRGTQRLLCAQVGRSFHVRHEEFDPLNYGVFHEGGEWRLARARKFDEDFCESRNVAAP
ncbi:MAG: ABC transporter ATP-binding protein [Bryobacteraceae bacterium]|nr:ABC transporter ATP-binding protein [Bryobacteraceae bacterium]